MSFPSAAQAARVWATDPGEPAHEMPTAAVIQAQASATTSKHGSGASAKLKEVQRDAKPAKKKWFTSLRQPNKPKTKIKLGEFLQENRAEDESHPSPHTRPLISKPAPRAENFLDYIDRAKWTDKKPAEGWCFDISKWSAFSKCYGEGRFNLSNTPVPPHLGDYNFYHAPLPKDEERRSQEADKIRGLYENETVSRAQYIADLARQILMSRSVAVSFVSDRREHLVVNGGYDAMLVPRYQSLAAHCLLSTEPMVIPDASKDWRFQKNPLVVGRPGIRFYAGAPLITTQGHIVGVLAVFDPIFRLNFPYFAKRVLADCARALMADIEIYSQQRTNQEYGYLRASADRWINYIVEQANCSQGFPDPKKEDSEASSGERAGSSIVGNASQKSPVVDGSAAGSNGQELAAQSDGLQQQACTRENSEYQTDSTSPDKSDIDEPDTSPSADDFPLTPSSTIPQRRVPKIPENWSTTSLEKFCRTPSAKDDPRSHHRGPNRCRSDSPEVPRTPNMTAQKGFPALQAEVHHVAKRLRFEKAYVLHIRCDTSNNELTSDEAKVRVLGSYRLDYRRELLASFHLECLSENSVIVRNNPQWSPESGEWRQCIMFPVSYFRLSSTSPLALRTFHSRGEYGHNQEEPTPVAGTVLAVFVGKARANQPEVTDGEMQELLALRDYLKSIIKGILLDKELDLREIPAAIIPKPKHPGKPVPEEAIYSPWAATRADPPLGAVPTTPCKSYV